MKNNTVPNMIFAALLAALCLAGQHAFAEAQLTSTPADYEGPFYPVSRQQDEDNDLVHVEGHAGIAKGDILNLQGIVLNTKGVPQENVTIEIWQTDPEGRYNHPGDASPGERDPNFQYQGRATTGTDGTFSFKTVIPGAYEPRPAHIHYKVWQDDKVVLTSQIYFKQLQGSKKEVSMTDKINLQTVSLKRAREGEFSVYFRIVI